MVVRDGSDFPRRQLTIFLTFGAIFITLVGQGLTFPLLLRRLKLDGDDRETRELRLAIGRISQVALARLRELEREADADPAVLEMLHRHYLLRAQRYGRESLPEHLAAARGYNAAARELLAAQRAELLRLQRDNHIDSGVRARIEAFLDLEEIELDGFAAVVTLDAPLAATSVAPSRGEAVRE
jgi:CPA1 family monovalent cation:H+ antiporter